MSESFEELPSRRWDDPWLRPLGPNATVVRALLWKNLAEKFADLWPPLPDDPFDPKDWFDDDLVDGMGSS